MNNALTIADTPFLASSQNSGGYVPPFTDYFATYGAAAAYSTRLLTSTHAASLLTTTGNNYFPDENGEITGAAVDAGISNSVQAWRDQSGNMVDLTAVTAYGKPTAGSATVMGTNDRLGIYFFNLNDVAPHTGNSFLRNTSDPFASLTECTVFAVLEKDAATTNGGLWRLGSTSGGNGTVYGFSDGKIYDGAGATTRKTGWTPSVDITTPHVYTVVSTASAWTAFLNGNQEFTVGTNTVGFDSDFWLGRAENPSSTFFQGLRARIMELVILESAPSVTDRNAIIANQAAWAGGISV